MSSLRRTARLQLRADAGEPAAPFHIGRVVRQLGHRAAHVGDFSEGIGGGHELAVFIQRLAGADGGVLSPAGSGGSDQRWKSYPPIMRSYSSCGPIQNHFTPSCAMMANAR